MSSLLASLRRVERAAAMTLLVGIFALVFVATAARYLGTPVLWAIEATQAMFIWLCVLAADITLQHRGHFSVPALADLLPPARRRGLEIFNALVVLALLVFLCWHGLTFAELTSGRPLPMIGLSSAVATAALPVGFALMAITIVEQLLMRLKRIEDDAGTSPRDVM